MDMGTRKRIFSDAMFTRIPQLTQQEIEYISFYKFQRQLEAVEIFNER